MGKFKDTVKQAIESLKQNTRSLLFGSLSESDKKEIDAFLSVDPALYEDATADHLHDLREKLLANGHIKSISQKYVYSDEAKEFCLEWYEEELARQDELGSTGSWGKYFEVYARIMYSIYRGQPFLIADCKCRACGLRDMFIQAENGVYPVELKTGGGAVGYGCDRVSAKANMEKFFKNNPIIVWDFECNGEPLCMRAYDLLVALKSYNPKKGLSTWFFENPNYNIFGKRYNRAYQIQFSISGDKKIKFLRELKKLPNAYSWERLVQHAEFKPESEC